MRRFSFFKKIVLHAMGKSFFGFIPDGLYLKMRYRLRTGKRLDLNNPETFNEKLQWLKIHDRKDIYTVMVDKYEVKEYVSNLIGKEYIIPTIGVYEKFDDIDFDKLPGQFVIKCTHDSGGNVICRDKTKLDIRSTKKRINKCLRKNYYYSSREWPYKNVKPRIIIEKYISDSNGKEIKDYKFFTFNGEPKIILVCSERSKNLKETWFDEDFNKIDVMEGEHPVDDDIEKPSGLKEMIRLAKKLANEIAFVRIDFYDVDGRIYFGEITFFPASGYERFDPEIWNQRLGGYIKLPSKKRSKK